MQYATSLSSAKCDVDYSVPIAQFQDSLDDPYFNLDFEEQYSWLRS